MPIDDALNGIDRDDTSGRSEPYEMMEDRFIIEENRGLSLAIQVIYNFTAPLLRSKIQEFGNIRGLAKQVYTNFF